MTPTIIDPSNPMGSWTAIIGSKDLQALPMDRRRHCARFTTAVNNGADRGAVASLFALALDELRGPIEAGLVRDLQIAETAGASPQAADGRAALGNPAPAASDDTSQESAVAPASPSEIASGKSQESTAPEPVMEARALTVVHAAEVVDERADPAIEINRLHGEIEAAYHTSLERAIRIGELLAEQKEALGHGQFLPWVTEHLPFSERTARNYMRVFSHRAELKSAGVADLTTAYRLPTPLKAGSPTERNRSAAEPAIAAELAAGPNDADDDSSGHPIRDPEERDSCDGEAGDPMSAVRSCPAAQESSDPVPPQPLTPALPVACPAPPETAPLPLRTTEPITVTRKQAMAALVILTRTKPAVADEIINEIAEAASRDVLVLEPDTRRAVSELSALLMRKLEELAEQDYDDARSCVEGICSQLCDAVNAYAPNSEDGEDASD